MGGEKLKMRNEELKKVLKELNQKLGKILEDQAEELTSELNTAIERAHNEKCSISIKKNKDGNTTTKLEGTTMAILVTLAGLEKTVLESAHVPNSVWEMIKETVNITEAK